MMDVVLCCLLGCVVYIHYMVGSEDCQMFIPPNASHCEDCQVCIVGLGRYVRRDMALSSIRGGHVDYLLTS